MGQSQLRSYSYSTPHLIYCHSFSFNIPSLPASRSHVSRSYVDSFFCYVCVSLFLVPRVDLRIEYQRSYIQSAAVPAPSALGATASSVFLPSGEILSTISPRQSLSSRRTLCDSPVISVVFLNSGLQLSRAKPSKAIAEDLYKSFSW